MYSLQQRIEASPYLQRLVAHSEFAPLVTAFESQTAPTTLEPELASIVARLALKKEDDFAAAEQALVQAKHDFALVWSLAELQQIGTQAERGVWQTRFAEATIDYALSLAWQGTARKQRGLEDVLEANDYRLPGLFVFGMGKLGGRDLNYSSDVDLVAYFDPDVLAVPDAVGKSYVCHQTLQELTRLLGQGGASDFIWRVDWRLRPNASATSLAMSVHAAEDYYFYHASPWHRLALMKARVVAGDFKLGSQFLASLSSFIWRQNLDFRALDELAEIKQRINLEHPGLRAQRQWVEPIGDNIDGFNVKLGSGGIREIEFFANAQQLLWGGRRQQLRTPNTVEALTVLSEQQRLAPEHAERLIHCYQFLRKVENAIQMVANQHMHLLPISDANKHAVLCLLNLDDWPQLVTQINEVRGFVHRLFGELFAEQEQHQIGPIVWPQGLSAASDEIVEGWENGFHRYGVSSSVRYKLKPLLKGLADYLNEGNDHSGPDVNDVIVRLHGFFKSLPQGEQYFRLLAESPVLLRSIVPPLLYSPAMTTLLTQSPHIVDCYVHGEWHYPEPFDSQYILQSDDYGDQLERLRRFVNEHLYQLYQQFLGGRLAADILQAALSDLAEHTLELALKVVADEMDLPEVPITVIGMGKVALRRMSPMSDLDLIFIYDAEHTSLELASRFVSRLQTAIASPMREGILYELDTRLRPSGRSGAPTVSIESFASHQTGRARTWEHIALMSSRVVAGRRAPQAQIDDIKRQVLTRLRSQSQLQIDARKMWLRVTEHRVGDTPLSAMNSKLRIGGLMQAEYLASCLVLAYGPNISADSVALDDLLAQSLPHFGLEELPEIIQFWRIQQLWERLLGKTEQPLSSLRDRYFARLLEQSNCSSMDELLAKKKRYSDYVVEGLNRFFGEAKDLSPQEIDDWAEAPIQWNE